MEEVTLEQVLEARETRVDRQNALLGKYHMPVISFGMNIPGPVKDTPLIRRAFAAGRGALCAALDAAHIEILEAVETLAITGCELQCAVKEDALTVKRVCAGIEDATPLGRLFDMDVLKPNGVKLDREEVDGGARDCIVCGAKGRGCASRRVHSVAELQAAAKRIMEAYFAEADRNTVSKLATKALLDEVYTTPKPGLVDRKNNGSHSDMTVATFEASAAALTPYWARCVQVGQESAKEAPEATFALLREAGMAAEEDMLAATNGVNTHKGAVFTLGVICGAIGRLWRAEEPCRNTDAILRECAAMTGAAVAADFSALSAQPETATTAGQRLYLTYGLRGIRGEVADGLPGVGKIALPMLRRALDAGYDRNDAGVYTLLALIARGTDTNMMKRGGAETAALAAKRAAELLDADPFPLIRDVCVLDEDFIAKGLSPGGCADLLAAAYFLHDWTLDAPCPPS